MACTRTIEDYVEEILDTVDYEEYFSLEDMHDTLFRMKDSVKEKHQLNYWRVLQCLGEVGIDKMIETLLRLDKAASKDHDYCNVHILMDIFVDSLCNVCVLKRVVAWKEKIIPVFLRAIRQTEIQELTYLGFDALLRCLIVGKLHLAEMYLRLGLMKDLHKQIKGLHDSDRFDYVVVLCSRLLLNLAQLGKDHICMVLRRSAAMRCLGEYIVKIGLKKITKFGVCELRDNFSSISTLMHDPKLSQAAFQGWNSKEKLHGAITSDTDLDITVFCSAPSCRKGGSQHVKFRYCGACKLSRYCSEECQKTHWKSGHKETCQGSLPF